MSFPAWQFRLGLFFCIAALAACAPGRPGAPPAPAAVPAAEDSLWTTEDGEDLRDETTIQDDENDPEIEIGAEPDEFTDPPPTEDGGTDDPALEPPTDTTVVIRAATFNAFLSGVAKSRRSLPDSVRTALGAPAGQSIGRFPFLAMLEDSIHIMAVQEIMINRVRQLEPTDSLLVAEAVADHATLSGGDARYRVLQGDPVQYYSFTFARGGRRISVTRCEFCPIIYDTTVLTCEEGGRVPIQPVSTTAPGGDTTRFSRHAHRANCTLVADAAQTFTFYCAHFAAAAEANRVNVQNTGTLLQSAARVIIGADFNSNASIGGAFGAAWQAALAGNGTYVRPTGDFTKVSLRGGLIQLRTTVSWRYLDDVLWNRELDPPIPPANLRKTVTTFGRNHDPNSAFYQQHYLVSDHFIVLGDFLFAIEAAQ